MRSTLRRLTLGLAVIGAGATSCATPPQDARRTTAAAEGPPICRDVLIRGSNVIETVCLTSAQWDAFDRRQRQEAQDLGRALQGSPYSSY